MNHDAYIIMIGAFSMPLLLQAINKSTSAFLCLEKQQDRKWILLMTIDHNIVQGAELKSKWIETYSYLSH